MSIVALSAEEMFDRARFIQWLGVSILRLDQGRCETALKVREEFGQQHGFIHAGIITTLADHSAGGAASTLLGKDESALTLEFKVNFLRPAVTTELFCVSEVLRRGRTIVVVESSVYSSPDRDPSRLIAKATVSMAIMKASES